MLKHMWIGCLVMAGGMTVGAIALADDKSDAQAAVKKVGDSANYSWSATTSAPAGGGRGGRRGGLGGPTSGKAAPAGYTTFTLTNQNGSYDVVIQGEKSVIKTDAGWQTMAELQKAADDAGGFTPETFLMIQVQNFKAPAVQAKEIADKFTNVKKTADGFTADLAEETAKSLLTFRFGARGGAAAPQIEVTGAKGTLKLWVTDGMANKMEMHLTGTRSFNGNDTPVDQTTTTEIKDVGSTKITVPDDAKKKLDAAPAATKAG